MSRISIHSYFSKIAFRTVLVLSLGIFLYLGVSLFLQYSEKKSQLELQATYVANALRNEFINGNQIYLYEQCRSLAAQENIRKIVIQRDNYVYCNEVDEGSRIFMISVSVPIKFQPNIPDSESDNIAGTITLGIDGSEMVYYAIASLIGLLVLSGTVFFYIKRSYLEMHKDILRPIKELTDAMSSGSIDSSINTTEFIRINELQTMFDSYLGFLEATKLAEDLRIEKTKMDAVISVAKQVAHDIRSPLSVLNMLVPTLSTDESKEKCDLLIQATQRIDEIAEELLAKGRPAAINSQLTSEDVEKLVHEKQMLLASQSQRARIELMVKKGSRFKTKLSKLDFERITSNLLNNAIEALTHKEDGLIELGISSLDDSTVIVIRDNGVGIDSYAMSKIGTIGFTSGKEAGNGLGVYHAKSTIEKVGGLFQIQSKYGEGTTITITI